MAGGRTSTVRIIVSRAPRRGRHDGEALQTVVGAGHDVSRPFNGSVRCRRVYLII